MRRIKNNPYKSVVITAEFRLTELLSVGGASSANTYQDLLLVRAAFAN